MFKESDLTFDSVLIRWINLEPIIKSEVSQKEKKLLYINAYIWNLKRWYWLIYLQSSNRDSDIKKRHVDTVGEGEGGTDWESSVGTYTLTYVKLDSQWKITIRHRELKSGALWQPRGMGWDRLGGGKV